MADRLYLARFKNARDFGPCVIGHGTYEKNVKICKIYFSLRNFVLTSRTFSP